MSHISALTWWTGNDTFASQCHDAFVKGQVALDQYLWNEGQQSYDAYTISGGFDYERYRNSTNLTLCQYEAAESDRRNGCIHGDPEATSPLMSDSFYAQVLRLLHVSMATTMLFFSFARCWPIL